MSSVHLRDLGVPRNQKEERKELQYAPPTPKRTFTIEYGKQEGQPGFKQDRNWGKLPEVMSQKDIFQRPYRNYQRLALQKAVQSLRREGSQATIQDIEWKWIQREHIWTPFAKQGVDQANSQVASNHSEFHKSVAESHHSS
ncbi:hypothetical protein O181_021511 [Austropuccinia psidii MF-1]|uniref:Uncharacterized protein n=1 Tax=Austropuccinia psidii MF-1 TaxID=1389203 RepID=A0A9Q3GVU8_9BASI|nr:hypothetical protein [Austropuccinia psidii MF-1]